MKLPFLAFLAASFLATGALAQSAAPSGDGDPLAGAQPVQVEFIQQAASAAFDGSTLRLVGPAAMTIFKATEPQPISGAVPNADFIEIMTSLSAASSADGPNAILVVAGSDAAPPVVKLGAVRMDGDAIVYDVTVLEGELPATAEGVALFIDPWIHVGPYRPWVYPRVVVPGPIVVGPRCHYSPYYYGRVCRW